MKAILDTHTHSAASGHHTTDTVTTLAKKAKELGLDYLCIADHAPAMPGSARESYFRNLRYAEKCRYGVNLVYGVELNVLDTSGNVDLGEDILKGLTFSIVSLHKDTFKHQNCELDTLALVNAMKNPYVSIVGHPDDPTYEIDFDLLTDAAKEYGVILEINSVGLEEDGYRQSNLEGLVKMVMLCKQKGVYVCLGSDSHGAQKIADFENSYALLKAIDFPEELVVNFSASTFFSVISKRRT